MALGTSCHSGSPQTSSSLALPSASPAGVTAPTPPRDSSPGPENVHAADGAGQWYPADPGALRLAVETFLSEAEREPLTGRLVAVIVPHAGYIYSGAVAAHAYRAMRQAGCGDQTIAVIGDTHTGNGSADIAVWAAGSFETPLGRIPVDEAVAQALVAADDRIVFEPSAFVAEHPVENQLPFIQVVCPGAQIVPIVIREPSLTNAQALAEALVAALGQRPALIVASTDLSHYHPYEEAHRIDEVALQAIVSLDPQALADSPGRCTELGIPGDPLTMCSQGAVMTAQLAARMLGANQATVLHYATSGDVPIGSRSQVVGYGAVALWVAGEGQPPSSAFELAALSPSGDEGGGSGTSLLLSPDEKQELLALARRTAAHFLATETILPYHTDDPALLQPLGAYVTYETLDQTSGEAQLRGCLGRLEGDRSAYLNVQYAALAAALNDPRFPPVTAGELEGLRLEITLLYPMRQAHSPDEIEIGREGVMMRVGQDAGALFLPQVPVDQGWDLPATLVNLCRKAGLPDDAWQRPEAQFFVFSGEWFGEGE
jgi:AmmeMemoRadiSam system protein B/AmmeMemoRadiSam system protein A